MDVKEELIVVAIGASAGGIEPLLQFFERLGPSSGLAFIVIQHLQKDHETLLPDLLAGTTDMKVATAAEGMEIERDHVYIIPAGVALTLHNGRLHTEDLGRKRPGRNVIDRFFRSLAHDCGPRAVCVILSGMGVDGVLGARTVKEHGGMVVAQTPQSAQYNSMPENAIAGGLADMILGTEEMPAAIAAAVKRSGVLHDTLDLDDLDTRLAAIFAELGARIAKEFGHLRSQVVLRPIIKRMALRHLDSLEEYARLLSEDAMEASVLLSNLLQVPTEDISVRALRGQNDVPPLYLTAEHRRPGTNDNSAEEKSPSRSPDPMTENRSDSPGQDEGGRRIQNQLKSTREYLYSTSEALEIANEELRASNEELRTMNEELQTVNEELLIAKENQQSLNGELVDVNTLLRRKLNELDSATSDLYNFFESTRIPLLFLDNDLNIKTYTPAAAELLGVSEQDVGAPADCIERCFEWVDVNAEAKSVIDNFEKRDIEAVNRQSGRHYVMQFRIYRTLQNVIDGLTISMIDVDDFKKVKGDLQIRERMLSLVTDSVPMLIAYIDADLIYRYCNAAYRRWFGLEREEVVGRNVAEVLGDEILDEIRPYFSRALAGEPVLYSSTLDLPRVGRRTLRVSYEPHVENNRVMGLIAFVQDETERMEHERKMGRLAAIVNATSEVIIGKDADGIITDWNQGAEELFGYSAEEAVGTHFYLTVPRDKREELAAQHRRLLEGETIEPFETVRLNKDGTRIFMLMSLSAIRSEDGEVVGISVVAHDISDRIEAEQRLAEFNEHLEVRVVERTAQLRNLASRLLSLEQAERRRFSQLLHDEIQQTLAAAKMLVEKSYKLSQAQARPSLSESLRLLSEAMEQARVVTAELSPPLFFETGISVCLQWIMRWAEAKFNFFLNIVVDGEERPIADEIGYFLYRSIRELVFNSYKHGGVEQADVVVNFKDDGALEVAVEDRGSGFDPKEIDTPLNEHFGVLSIIEQVGAMAGSVNIISRPGGGARTVISLPADMVEPAVPEESPRETKENLLADNRQQVEAGGEKPIILIVDDQEDLRFTLRLMLEDLSSHYTFVEAEDGLRALDMVREYDPQLVLMDISMPGMSGVETTRRVKELKEEIVVIGLSMHEREDMEAAMRKAGAECYVTKDSASEVILEMIEQHLPERA
ncbi:MAG TPA: chemotaxis protein CheB [Desulfopila sp.]|nr:chemotaxis protein CheB [Desulfopila sp.]